nr:hypothetical protein [Actinopolymorpha pittospori]
MITLPQPSTYVEVSIRTALDGLSMVLTRKSHGHQAGGSEPRPVMAGQRWSGGWWLGGFGFEDDGFAVADEDLLAGGCL